MKYRDIKYEKTGRAAHIVLGAPRKGSQTYECMCAELHDVCDIIDQDDSIIVVVIRSSGKTFLCSVATELDSHICTAIEKIARMDKITVAVIEGDAFGEGLELALACDIRIASDKARFRLANVAEGTIPCGGGTQRLPRLIGQAKAMEMILTASTIDAVEAFRIGLIQKMVPLSDIEKESDTLVQKIAEKGPIALKFCKEAVNKGVDLTLEQGLRLEADLYFLIQTTDDRMEGIRSFLEKRKPSFKGE